MLSEVPKLPLGFRNKLLLLDRCEIARDDPRHHLNVTAIEHDHASTEMILNIRERTDVFWPAVVLTASLSPKTVWLLGSCADAIDVLHSSQLITDMRFQIRCDSLQKRIVTSLVFLDEAVHLVFLKVSPTTRPSVTYLTRPSAGATTSSWNTCAKRDSSAIITPPLSSSTAR